jgi:peptide-methionine (S)-S-oxide reductase
MTERKELATFAGGCFWCMVKPFDQFDGIHSIISGYTGGHTANPTYEDVKKGDSGHYEVVQIEFDPEVFLYEDLLELFWQQVDPTDEGGQFHDRGDQYRTAVFYHNEAQRDKAIASRNKLQDSGKFSKPIVTKVLPAETFYPAEDYHQDYYKKNTAHYKEDREKSGRDEFIKEHWEK